MTVSLSDEPTYYLDEFVDDSGITMGGSAVLRDGTLTLDQPVVFRDDFNRTDIAPWTLEDGRAEISDGLLALGSRTLVNRDVWGHDLRMQGRLMFPNLYGSGTLLWIYTREYTFHCEYRWGDPPRMYLYFENRYTNQLIDMAEIHFESETWYDFKLDLGGSYFGVTFGGAWIGDFALETSMRGDVEAVGLSTGSFSAYYDDIVVLSDEELEGTATTGPIQLPPDCLWDRASAQRLDQGYGSARMDILDAGTMEAVPGYDNLGVYQSSTAPPDIEGVHFERHSTIRLRIRMEVRQFDAPVIDHLFVSWKPGGNLWMDAFDDMANLSFPGGTSLNRGHLVVDHEVQRDDFNGSSMSPWTWSSSTGGGSCHVEGGSLVYAAGPDAEEGLTLERPIDILDPRLDLRLMVDRMGARGLNLTLTTDSGKGMRMAFDPAYRYFNVSTCDGTNWTSHSPRWCYLRINTWATVSLLTTRDGNGWAGVDDEFVRIYEFPSHGENYTRAVLAWGANDTGRIDICFLHSMCIERSAVSEAVVLPPGMLWQRLRLSAYRYTSSSHDVQVDVLDGRTLELVPGYGSVGVDSMDLRGMDPGRHPSLRLRVRLLDWSAAYSHFHPWPYLDWWQLWWEPGEVLYMDPFDDGLGVESKGEVGLVDGHVRTLNILFEDHFDRMDIGTWERHHGISHVYDCQLRTIGTEEEHSWVCHDLPASEDFRMSLGLSAVEFGPEYAGISLRFGRVGTVFVEYWHDEGKLVLWGDDGINMPLGMEACCTLDPNTQYAFNIRFSDSVVTTSVGGVSVSSSRPTAFQNLDRMYLMGGRGSDLAWDDLVVTEASMAGSATTAPFELPRDGGWLLLELGLSSTFGSTVRGALLDANTLEPVPGFEDLDDETVNLTLLDRTRHPIVRLFLEMEGDNETIPSLDYFMLLWENLPGDVVQLRPFGPIKMTEDVPAADVMDLLDYFTARDVPPGDLAFEVVDVSLPDLIGPRVEGSMLSIDLPTRNANGNATFRVRCSHGGSSWTSEAITVVVEPVDDPPVISGLEDIDVTEGVELVVDLLQYVFDVDTPFWELNITIEGVEGTIDGSELRFLFETGGMDIGALLLVSDGTTLASQVFMVHVWEVNDPPVVGPIPRLTVREDEAGFFDLSPFISDEETANEYLVMSSDDPGVQSIENLTLWLIWTVEGYREVTIRVSDGAAETTATFIVEVDGRNDPPRVVSVGGEGPPFHVAVPEGRETVLLVVVEDEEGGDVRIFLGPHPGWLSVTDGGNLRCQPPAGPLLPYVFNLTAWDEGGARTTVQVTLRLELWNDPPDTPVILHPEHGSTWRVGKAILFDVKVSDPDMAAGQVLRVIWTSHISGELWNISSDEPMDVHIRNLPVGVHVIKVRVTDGEYEASAWIEITVKEGGDEGPEGGVNLPGWLVPLLLLASAVLVAFFLSVYWNYRKIVRASADQTPEEDGEVDIIVPEDDGGATGDVEEGA